MTRQAALLAGIVVISIIWLICPVTTWATELPLTTQNERTRVHEGAAHSAVEQAQIRAGEPSEPQSSAPPAAVDRRQARHPDLAWVSSVGMLLIGDRDRDGYHTGFSLTLDVDTAYAYTDVYASLYLQLENAALEHLHTTRDFRIHGTSSADAYRIDVELVDNYRIGHYDLVIDIHDSLSSITLDSIGPGEFRNLDGLPLESEEWSPPDDDVLVAEYAGAGGPVLLALLSVLWAGVRRHAGVPTGR